MERLRTALADTYQAGGDYDALVKAVQDEYSPVSTMCGPG